MANVKTYYVSTQGNTKLSTNFTVREFACKDGSDKVLIDLDLVAILQKIRDSLGAAITITSGYRTATYNASIGGATNSYHIQGMAADIVVAGKTTSQVAASAETNGALGILRYITSNFVHVDTRTIKYFATITNGVTTTVSTHGGTSSGGSSTISAIQTKMNSLYGTGLAVDGVYGANTKKALIKGLQTEFNKQYRAGLAVDGVWGNATKLACPTLSAGASGNIVYILQAGLYCIGGNSMAVDGSYGTGTTSAVKSFQTAKRLSPDGVAGPNTFAAMFA